MVRLLVGARLTQEQLLSLVQIRYPDATIYDIRDALLRLEPADPLDGTYPT